MEKELYINPIIEIGAGCCPSCLTPLKVIDTDVNFIDITQDGTPIKIENKFHEAIGYCESCGKSIEMYRYKGNYYPYSRGAYILDMLELRDEAKERVKTTNISTDNNPFLKK